MDMTNPFADAQLLDCPPPDALRKAAESLSLGTKMTVMQVRWAKEHDWFDSATADGVIVVTDCFTYRGRSFTERLIWGGTFDQLRDWAGY